MVFTTNGQRSFFNFLVLFSILSEAPPYVQSGTDLAIEDVQLDDSVTRTEMIELAKLAQELGRYGTMAMAMHEAVKISVDTNKQMTFNERELLRYSYKIIADARRSALQLIRERLYEGKHHSENYLKVLRKMKTDVAKELVLICNDAIELSDKLLKNKKISNEAKVFHTTMKADYMRYFSETQNYDAALETNKRAREVYEEAYKLTEELSPKSETRIEVVTKMTTMLCDNLLLIEDAYNLANEAVEAAEKEIERIKNMKGGQSFDDRVTKDELDNINQLKANRDSFKKKLEVGIEAEL